MARPGSPSHTAKEEDDDPVVAEFEVWHSKELFDCLNLFQFPLRAAGCGYNMQKLRRLQKQVQAQRYRIEFDPRQSIEGFGETTVEDADVGDVSSGIRTQPFVVSSSRVQNKTNYAVGVVRGDRLTLTALSHVHQFRPDLEAIRALNPRLREGGTRVLDEPLEKVARPKLDTVKLEYMRQYQLKLRSAWQEQRDREQWLTIAFKDQHDVASRFQTFNKLFCQESRDVPHDSTYNNSKYLRDTFRLCYRPPSTIDDWMESKNKDWKVPLAHASSAHPELQIRSLLRSAHVLPFARLKGLLSVKGGVLDSQVLPRLPLVAVLIRGLWVAKKVPEYRGVQALAREWILLKLWENDGVIKRKWLSEPPYGLSLDAKALRVMLEDVAELDPKTRDWVIKHGSDPDFMQAHPALVKQEEENWAQWKPQITRNASGVTPAREVLEIPRSKDKGVPSGPVASSAEIQRKLNVWLRNAFDSKGRGGVWTKAGLQKSFARAQERFQQSGRGVVTDDMFDTSKKLMTRDFRASCLVLRKLGSDEVPLDVDPYRDAFIAAFQHQAEWPVRQLLDHTAATLPQDKVPVPQHLLQQILEELALCQGKGDDAVWTVREGREAG
eukprot:TRINITY_DN16413_c0_g1_i1.p1 TRINITY_DN16413_c0_g1~~TRINITY_DN16413_c0_g1_i1.p1  ORF type:complete len:625 (+),score=205.39 TRINITY_DN16413_c0_g1_i1:54-1877(+)